MKEFNMSPEEAKTSEFMTNATEINNDNFYVVKERFEIDYNQPLPDLDTNGAKAYTVKDKINPQKQLFALICDNQFPARLSILPYLKSIDHPNILKLVDFSVVDYVPESTMNMALIYVMPTGPKVSDVILDNKITTEKFKSLTSSMASACESLRTYHITHRAIRPNNLFFKDNDCNEIVLGDCAASFPALYQPDVYETIESLLCIPQGRGNGTCGNDIYAAGVTLLGLAIGKEITTSIDTSELIQQKLKKGSLITLLSGEKINSQLSPILKGMLEDDSDIRWKPINVFNFLENKNNHFSNSDGSDKSMRALTIGGEKYYTTKSAALAVLSNPSDAFTLAKNGKILDWIKNGLENEKLHSKMEKLLQQNKENESAVALAPIIAIYLDASLPIKCGDTFIFPSGLSKALYYYTITHQPLDAFYNLFSSDLIKIWYQEQPYAHAPANSSDIKTAVARNSFGYGIDRIMYEFDEDLPCTSELIGKEFVNTPSKLLKALNLNYNKFRDKQPFDKNVIAYLRCKMGKKIDGIITDINANQDALRVSAVIRLYANIQNKNGPVQLNNLTRWLLKASKPIISSFHNVKYRKFLEKELVKVSKNGKIIELYELLENEEARLKDRQDYAEALKKINILMTERNRILAGDAKLDDEAKELAVKFASMLSILTMLASFMFSIIYWVLK